MSGWKKLASAAAATGGALNVEDVFSTYLYEGAGAAKTITNGIDLSTEGGLVWTKARESASFPDHFLVDSERGGNKTLNSNNTNAEVTQNYISSFNADGFTYANNTRNGESGIDYASWTLRKAPKFFDVVTYTGDGTAGRTISHNLGTTVGMIIVKRLNAGTNWGIYHRSNTSSPQGQVLEFDTGSTASNTTIWNNTAPTSTVFTVGNSPYSNFNGSTYVAYLFAHNDGDGEFGPTGDQDIIKCGSYTATNGTALDVDLGFEPQWVMVKRYDSAGYWWIQDSMRGWGAENSGDSQKYLQANDTAAEKTKSTDGLVLTSTGFTVPATSGDFNSNGDYIYIAIRRGPMAVPESATDVFVTRYRGEDAVSQPPMFYSGWPVDMAFQRSDVTSTSENRFSTRLTGYHFLDASTTEAEQTGASSYTFDYQDGWVNATGTVTTYRSWMWRRAPNFLDVVAYTGDQVAGRTVSHNLGVVPEMIITKRRSTTGSWVTYHKDIGNTGAVYLDSSTATVTTSSFWNDTSPTASSFSVGTGVTNTSGASIIAYLFATLAGVSKVGSFSGNNASNRTIDCGFSSGARLVIVKCTNQGGTQWFLWDTERGITTGNDPYLLLNADIPEQSSLDLIEPHSSGFAVNYNAQEDFNQTGNDYIFYAIA